jgi:hypothetical protein
MIANKYILLFSVITIIIMGVLGLSGFWVLNDNNSIQEEVSIENNQDDDHKDDYTVIEPEIIDNTETPIINKDEEEFREMTEEEAELILQTIEDANSMFTDLKDQGDSNATDITVQWLKEQPIIKDASVLDSGDISFEFETGLQAFILLDRTLEGFPDFSF